MVGDYRADENQGYFFSQVASSIVRFDSVTTVVAYCMFSPDSGKSYCWSSSHYSFCVCVCDMHSLNRLFLLFRSTTSLMVKIFILWWLLLMKQHFQRFRNHTFDYMFIYIYISIYYISHIPIFPSLRIPCSWWNWPLASQMLGRLISIPFISPFQWVQCVSSP